MCGTMLLLETPGGAGAAGSGNGRGGGGGGGGGLPTAPYTSGVGGYGMHTSTGGRGSNVNRMSYGSSYGNMFSDMSYIGGGGDTSSSAAAAHNR